MGRGGKAFDLHHSQLQPLFSGGLIKGKKKNKVGGKITANLSTLQTSVNKRGEDSGMRVQQGGSKKKGGAELKVEETKGRREKVEQHQKPVSM